jgi:molybdopterin converting factor subunit 1
MKVKLLLFAAAKEAIGQSQLCVDVQQPFTVGQLKQTLASRYPELNDLVGRSAFSVDQKYAADDTEIDSQSEVAMIPPVSGG